MCALSKFSFLPGETFQKSLFTKLDRILSLALYKSFPSRNLNFEKAHTQPISLLHLDSSTYIETLLHMCTYVLKLNRVD